MKIRQLETAYRGNNIYSINEFDMDYMYIVKGSDRALLIDTGTGTSDYKSISDKIVGNLPYDVVCTHSHIDHVGGIDQFERIYIHPDDIPPIMVGGGKDGCISVFNHQRYAKRGFAVNPDGSLPFTMEDFHPIDATKIEFIPIREGFSFDLGDRSFEVIEMPGHSKGCICLLDTKNKVLFAGDNVARVLILSMDLSIEERVSMWLDGAKKLYARKNDYNTIYAGHLCPAPMTLFEDMIRLAESILDGSIKEEYAEVDEFKGPLFRYKSATFTLDPENLKTRDYRRILNPGMF